MSGFLVHRIVSKWAMGLKKAIKINGCEFDGTKDITVEDDTKLPLEGGTLTGDLFFSTETMSAINPKIISDSTITLTKNGAIKITLPLSEDNAKYYVGFRLNSSQTSASIEMDVTVTNGAVTTNSLHATGDLLKENGIDRVFAKVNDGKLEVFLYREKDSDTILNVDVVSLLGFMSTGKINDWEGMAVSVINDKSTAGIVQDNNDSSKLKDQVSSSRVNVITIADGVVISSTTSNYDFENLDTLNNCLIYLKSGNYIINLKSDVKVGTKIDLIGNFDIIPDVNTTIVTAEGSVEFEHSESPNLPITMIYLGGGEWFVAGNLNYI